MRSIDSVSLAAEWSAAGALSVIFLRRFLSEDFLSRSPIADRGYYIACSKLVAGGAVLYRDIFDNKPPVIHLLGALAWRLSPSVRAVFRMEQIMLLLLASALFAMLRFGLGVRTVPALSGLLIGLITLRNPDVLQGGHLTEEYGIAFEIIGISCLLLALRGMCRRTGSLWAVAAGVFAAVTLLTRQTFLVSIVTIWVVAHASLIRELRSLVRIVMWEAVGFAFPIVVLVMYLWGTGGLAAYLELLPETHAYWRASQGGLDAKLMLGIHWMVVNVFHDTPSVAITTAVIAVAAVVVAVVRTYRGAPPISVTPLLLPLWFAAEMVAASAPGDYYGHYYIPFVPLFACIAALVAELVFPRGVRRRPLPIVRLVSWAALLTTGAVALDSSYRADPMKYWFPFAPDARFPSPVIELLRKDANNNGWRHYVPLQTTSPAVLLDMPLPLGTRFLFQYPYQFAGPDSARGRELLADIARADIVVYDGIRLRLDLALEARIREMLQRSFTPLFSWSHFQFLVRRGPPAEGDVPAQPPAPSP
jgi:hypothetical protein